MVMDLTFRDFIKEYKNSISNLIRYDRWDLLDELSYESLPIFQGLLNMIEDKIDRHLKDEIFLPSAHELHFHSFLIKILNYDSSFLADEKKLGICSKILENFGEISSDIQPVFIDTFGDLIISNFKRELLEDHFLTYHFVQERPELMVRFFPEILNTGGYENGLNLILYDPTLLNKYPKESEKVLNNLGSTRREEKDALYEIISLHRPELKKIFKKQQLEGKNRFLEEMEVFIKNNADFAKFPFNSHELISNLDCFSNSELISIVKRLLDLKIPFELNLDPLTSAINFLLLELASSKRCEMLLGFIESMITLGYHWPVAVFFKNFPSEIKKLQFQTLEKIATFFIGAVLKEILNFLDNEDLLTLFRKLVGEDENPIHVISTFYSRYPDFHEKFNEIVLDVGETIDVGKGMWKNESRLFDLLMSYSFGSVPKRQILILEKKISEYIEYHNSFSAFKPVFLFQNFLLLKKKLQKQIVSDIIKERKLNLLEIFAIVAPDTILKYLDEIINLDPTDANEIGYYTEILKILIINKPSDTQLLKKVGKRIKKLPSSYYKGQLLSFLGHYYEATISFEEQLLELRPFPMLITIYLDYLVARFEANLKEMNLSRVNDLLQELTLVKETFEIHNTNEMVASKFFFKFKYFKARLHFHLGQSHMSNFNIDESRENFKVADNIFGELKDVSQIPLSVKEDLVLYQELSAMFCDFVSTHHFLMKNKPELILSNFSDKIHEIRSQLKTHNLKRERFFRNIDESLKKLKGKSRFLIPYIRFVQPATFCPRIVPLKNKRLIDQTNNQVTLEWNQNNEIMGSNKSILIGESWKRFQLIFEIPKNYEFDTRNFILNINYPKYCRIEQDELRSQIYFGTSMKFEFELKSERFEGIRELLLEVVRNDLCGVPLKLNLPICFTESFRISESRNETVRNILEKLINAPDNRRDLIKLLDFLVSLYESNKIRAIFKKKIDEAELHNYVFHNLYRVFKEGIQDESKVSKGRLDILALQVPLEVKVESKLQEIKEIFSQYKAQIKEYCYRKGKSIGILLVYEQSKKERDYPKEDIDVLREGNYDIIIIIIRGNLSFPSKVKHAIPRL